MSASLSMNENHRAGRLDVGLSHKQGRPAVYAVLGLILFAGLASVAAQAEEPIDPTPNEEGTMEERCRKEVLELHQFFQDWFQGTLPDTDQAFGRFTAAMHEDFRIVSPTGRMTAAAPLSRGLRDAHGRWGLESVAAGSRIWIGEQIQTRVLTEGMTLVVYEEWQQHEGPAKGRLSSALFVEAPDAPNGVRWLHLHETWLPPTRETP